MLSECKCDGRVSKLEARTDAQEKRLDELEDDTKSIPKLETLMDMVVKSYDKQSDTLDNINKNLTGLNNKMDGLDQRVYQLEEGKQENRKDVRKIVIGIVTTLVGAWLLIQFGLK